MIGEIKMGGPGSGRKPGSGTKGAGYQKAQGKFRAKKSNIPAAWMMRDSYKKMTAAKSKGLGKFKFSDKGFKSSMKL